MDKNNIQKGWDEKGVQKLIAYYESQSEEEAVAEDEAAFDDQNQTFMEIPNALVPEVWVLVAHYR